MYILLHFLLNANESSLNVQGYNLICWSMSRYTKENYITVGYLAAKAKVIDQEYQPCASRNMNLLAQLTYLAATAVGLMWNHNIMNFVICIILIHFMNHNCIMDIFLLVNVILICKHLKHIVRKLSNLLVYLADPQNNN